MKRIACLIIALTISFGLSFATTVNAEATHPEDPELADWIIPDGYDGRISVKKTTAGVVLDQLVQGTPSSHAVVVSAPLDDTNCCEVEFKINMEEFVASGRTANDVWSGVGFMGKPVFINWRNNAQGYAKDSPGLFTRFFNYSGEYRIITDVYHENYLPGEGMEKVDTWTVLNRSVNAFAKDYITMKLAYEKSGDDHYYNLYINGKLLSTEANFLNVRKDVVFPDNKIYIMFAMNTQINTKVPNENSQIIIKRINNTIYGTGETQPDNPGGQSPDEGNEQNLPENEKKGCGSSAAGLPFVTVLLAGAAYSIMRKRNR